MFFLFDSVTLYISFCIRMLHVVLLHTIWMSKIEMLKMMNWDRYFWQAACPGCFPGAANLSCAILLSLSEQLSFFFSFFKPYFNIWIFNIWCVCCISMSSMILCISVCIEERWAWMLPRFDIWWMILTGKVLLRILVFQLIGSRLMVQRRFGNLIYFFKFGSCFLDALLSVT